MNKKIRYIFIACFILSACRVDSPAPVPMKPTGVEASNTPGDKPSAPATQTALPLVTFTATVEPGATISATLAPSATDTLEPTLTPTATTEPLYNLPGFYPVGGCVSYSIYKENNIMDFCVVSVEIKLNGTMVFNVRWTLSLADDISVTKKSDANNRKMYLTDNLGNRYDHIATGGSASHDVGMGNGATQTGSFEFPRAKPGAVEFFFHDDNQPVTIGVFVFNQPIILYESVNLVFYNYSMEFLLDRWTVETSQIGGVLFIHKNIEHCLLQEMSGKDIEGKFKNIVELSGLVYEIYGYLETDWGIREYVVVDGLNIPEGSQAPIFIAQIPYDNDLQCIFDYSEILGTLQVIAE